MGYGLARDFTPIAVFPRRAGVVASDHRPLLVAELRVRRLQRPSVFAIRSLLTCVNLRSGRVRLQDNSFAGRRFNLLGHIGTRPRLSVCQRNHSAQNGNWQKFCNHGQKSNTTGTELGPPPMISAVGKYFGFANFLAVVGTDFLSDSYVGGLSLARLNACRLGFAVIDGTPVCGRHFRTSGGIVLR